MSRRASKKPAKRHAAKTKSKRKPVKVAKKATKRKSVAPKALPAPAGVSAKKAAIEYMEFCHRMTVSAFKDWPADKVCAQAEGQPNHLLWTVGHLAMTYQWFANLLDGRPKSYPERYEALFGFGTKPTSDASQYPSLDEVRRVFDESYARILAAAQATSDADMPGAPLGESGGFVSNRLDVILKNAWHDGWHTGQLSVLRKFLGLAGLM